MRLTITRCEYFRAALFVPLAVPMLACLLLWIDLPRQFAYAEWVRLVDQGLGTLVMSAVFYGLPYGLIVLAIWRRSRSWTARQFWLLLGGPPPALAIGLIAMFSLGGAGSGVLTLIDIALVIGYGQALLIACLALLGQLVRWIAEPTVPVLPAAPGAHVA